MSEKPLYKFEMHESVVEYLLQCVDARQVRGSDQARTLLGVMAMLKNPSNLEEIVAFEVKEKAEKVEEAPEEEVKPEEVKSKKKEEKK